LSMRITNSLRHILPGRLKKSAAPALAFLGEQRFAHRPGKVEPRTESTNYAAWTVIADRIKRAGVRTIVDIGCGPSQFPAFLHDQGVCNYIGLDFSVLRRGACPELDDRLTDSIFASNVLTTGDFDAVVALEFLEQVEQDLEVLSIVKPGTLILGAVRNISTGDDVRHFSSVDAVHDRYRGVIEPLRVDALRGNREGQLFFILEGRV